MKKLLGPVLTVAFVAGTFLLSGTLATVSGVLAVIALAVYFFTADQTKKLLRGGADWYISDPKRKEKARKWIHKSD